MTTNARTRIRQTVQATRAELLGDFGIRHEDVEPVEGTTHDQEFRCDSGMDEPARVLHVFFDEQVNGTDADPGRR